MRKLRHGRPLWLDRSSRQHTYPRHRGPLAVDVVIVGGGISGAICAYLFAEAGVKVAVLEASAVGRGSTAASSALLMQEPDRDFGDLSARFGRRGAQAVWKALQRATRNLARAIRELQLDAGLCECDSVYFTLDPDKIEALRGELKKRKAEGLPGRWLSSAALYRRTGIRAQAAILTRGNAQVDPLRACHGFLSAAARLGAQVFERSTARRVKVSKGGVQVRTGSGLISARCVVVATGYATGEFRGRVGRLKMKDTYVIATRRLPRRLRPKRAGAQPMAWDTERPYHYIRWTEDGRLLVGGADTSHRSAKGSRQRIVKAEKRLLAYLAQVYPELAGETPDYAWEGLFAETPDGLPYIGAHSRYPKHLFALGYGGNGMTASFLAAQLLLGLYRGREGGAATGKTAKLFAFRRPRR